MGHIYIIECLQNDKVYIGQTSRDFKQRWSEHKSDLKHGNHPNKDLQDDFNKYGLNNFKVTLLEKCKCSELENRETYYINAYGGIESALLYNKCDLTGHNFDYKTNQSKAQIGVSYISEDGKNRISKAHKGKKLSEETKLKIKKSIALNLNSGMKGKHHSEESRRKMSNAKKGVFDGCKNPNFKYTQDFINQLKEEYNICHNYSMVARNHNMSNITVSSLIRFGKCV